MISRRDFLQAAAAVSAIASASGIGPLGRAAAQQRLTAEQIVQFDRLGSVSLLYVTDIHAQLLPLYFREPSINLGVGEASGQPPHLTDRAFLEYFKIAAGSADAYALTAEDFTQLAKQYGRMGGLDRIATLVKMIRADRGNDNVLLLDGGDTWQGSWTSLQTKGQDMVDAMSKLGVEAMVGHWEFTLGADRVKEIADSAPFAFLAQNIRRLEWQEPVFKARKSFVKGGARIDVIGQAMPRTPISNPRWMIPDWEFGLREAELQKEVDAARAEGADVVILISHNGFDIDKKLASRVKGMDVILTAHTHDALPALVRVGDTVLVGGGSHGKFLARLDLEVKQKKVTDVRYKLMPVFSDAIAPDAEMKTLIDAVRAPHKERLSQKLATTESLLYRRGNFNGTFDDLICDAIMKERDTEIALSPGFRWGASLLPGDTITFDDVANATSITYPACYRMSMTGEQIKVMLEDVADNIFHPDPYFQAGGDMVRVGGVGYAIDVSKPAGDRISGLTHLATGKPLDASRAYSVAGWASVNQNVEGPPIWEVVEKYLSSVKTVHIKPNSSVRISGI